MNCLYHTVQATLNGKKRMIEAKIWVCPRCDDFRMSEWLCECVEE